MRFNTFRFLVKEGFRGMGKNWFMSAASVLVLVSCLIITGCAYLVLENIDHGFDWAYQQNVMVAYAETEVTADRLTAMKTEIEQIANVSSVELQSRDSLLEEYAEDLNFGDAVMEDLRADNPLPDSFIIHFDDLEQFNATASAIAKIDGIEDVEYDQELTDTLVQLRNLIATIGGWVIALLLLVSLFIISNTIKLTVYSRRLEIYIMRSVGATRWFIRFPFVVEGIVLGAIAGGLAYGMVFLLYEVVGNNVDFGNAIQLVSFNTVWWELLVGFAAGGILTGMLGSSISMTRYLKENIE